MKSRLALLGVMAAATMLPLLGCNEGPYVLTISIISATTDVAPGDSATFVVTSSYSSLFDRPRFQIRMEWGDRLTTMGDTCSAGDTVRFSHAWQDPGTYSVKATVYGFSSQVYPATKSVVVSGPGDPVIDSARFYYLWRPTELAAWAHDPGGDSLRLVLAWSDGYQETTGFQASPCRLSATHQCASTGQVSVVFKAMNGAGAVSAPETLSGTAGAGGGVQSYSWGTFGGSPAVVDSIVYLVGQDGFFGLRPSGAMYGYAGSFSGHPSYSSQTGHVYIGDENGYLHAFTKTLGPVWEYPEHESLTYWEWGPVAVKGNMLYVPCSNGSIYCFVDNGTSVSREATFSAPQVDAVVVDAAGCIYFGTVDGYLYKLTTELNLIWCVRLQAGGSVFGPVIGADGTVYCSSDSGRVYAVDPADGSVEWTVSLNGVCYRPVVGSDGLYAATTASILYKLSITGVRVWERKLGDRWLTAAPVLVSGGYAYVQTEDDRLYNVSASTGDSVWVCNADAYLPRQPRYRLLRPSSGVNSPSIDASGNVWLVGSEALYQVCTYGRLDAASPWPKWQHDVHNTGYVGVGK